ncbi:hypothetical protein [Rhizobium sp. BK176]|uniref:hypothetical protein n=1 Tax=Rhizobium sp. BK176 TaxID=2587071 RepID=UPI002168293F|nr:hypothetical protein [Rhizobium sp. BK176]MCS4088961.1 hypothetical protein [Rhizobium sp. BK176]
MEQILLVDKKLVAMTERWFLSARTKLGLTHPAALAWAGSITIVLMALSVFLGTGNLYYTKIPLLVLYAGLALFMSRTTFRFLGDFHDDWGPEAERLATNIALSNRRSFWPMRLVFFVISVFFVFNSASFSLRLLDLGMISFARFSLDVFCSLAGFPTLVLYQYVQCARPNGGRVL